MIIKKLSTEIQSILNASSKINNYKHAVEELVYNSLDADATSVAVRIHIYENIIQVIDNGFGIAKSDIPLLGQRYASGKVTDKPSLKSAPIKFGFRGESLSNIIEVSQCVKITTRPKNSDETWVKTFYKGQHKDSQITLMRPSKGTTVEIKGFLYNLHIQKKATNPLNELHNIKLFLEQLSLVNTNVSVSLRDNSKNEIIFKVHKNRDIYQTLSSLYGLEKNYIQELQIEKYQYKAKGFIGKQNCKINSYQWIYLNGRFVTKCVLHDIVNACFTKNKQQCRNVKNKSNFRNFDDKIQNNEIPSYFIFITCPYLDYDTNVSSSKTTIEFKDWKQIRELLQKLVQFYKGDIKLNKLDFPQTERKNKIENTREEVRKIMEKVLGNKNKISQLCKGVKGKIVKKKKNQNSVKQFKNMHKVNKKNKEIGHTTNVPGNPSSVIEASISMNLKVSSKNAHTEINHNVKKINGNNKVKQKKSKLKIEPIMQQNKKKKLTNTNYQKLPDPGYLNKKENTNAVIEDKYNSLHNEGSKKKLKKDKVFKRKNEQLKVRIEELNPTKKHYMQETALEMFRDQLPKPKVTKVNEVQDNNPYIFDIKGDTGFLQSENNIHNFYEHKLAFNSVTYLNEIKKNCLKSSDLLKTILNSQKSCSEKHGLEIKKPSKIQHIYRKSAGHEKKIILSIERQSNFNIINDTVDRNIVPLPDINYSTYIRKQNDHLQNIQESFQKKYSDIERDIVHLRDECKLTSNFDRYYENRINSDNIESNISTTHIQKSFPKLTFESHKYNVHDAILKKKKHKRFISKQSKENFNPHNNIQHTYLKHRHFTTKNRIKSNKYIEHKSSHTIEFSTNNVYNIKQNTTFDQWKYKIIGNVQNTYTILDSNVSLNIASYLNNLNKSAIHHGSAASYIRCNLSSANELVEKERHQDHTVMHSLEENNLGENVLDAEMVGNGMAFNFSQKTDDHIEPMNVCEAVYQDFEANNINNSNMDRDKTVEDNVNLTTENKERYASTPYNNDVMSRYFQTIENMHNISLNDYHLTTNIEKNNKSTSQLEENKNDNYNRVEDKSDKPAFVINEVETSRHFHIVDSDQMQMGKSKNLFSSEEYNKERRNITNECNEDSNLVANSTRIGSDSNVIEVVHNGIIIEDQNTDIENLNNCNTTKDKEICIEDHTKPTELGTAGANNERLPNDSINEKPKRTEDFKLQNRHRFVPKGMSPIFEKCNGKNICSYNLEKNYFQDDLYNNFANNVLDNIKIYENKVTDMNGLPKNIKDPNCLKFDTQSLKDAKVFGQVDKKFIVAELKSNNLNMKHLVLFDQHAVHERIRLEENLADYKDGHQWKSINCEAVSLKLSKDDVLYLNNFKDKMKKLGLDWKIENDSLITINAVPKAIFGKYCRQADVIIQSIKNLIVEEIKAIKSLGGNTLLYPKSIMDLVFSEACRHAIKFGDKLSKGECITLISSLSSCKTPFQCAHGRPVLAVLSDLNSYCNEYKVDTSKILSFKNKLK